MARALKRLKIKPERIATSPLPRALRTAEIVAEVMGRTSRIEVVDDLRASQDASGVEAWLATRTETRLMVLGPDHPNFCELRKAGFAALRFTEEGRYQIDWIARPKLFRI